MARDSDFKEQIGRHVHFDLVDFDKVNSFRAPKNMSINDVKVLRWALWFDMTDYDYDYWSCMCRLVSYFLLVK